MRPLRRGGYNGIMKGIVFNLLEEAVTAHHGEETWDTVLDTAELEGAYTSLGSYPDEEFVALVNATAQLLDREPQPLIRWFGRQALPMLGAKYPRLFAGYSDSYSFVLALNDIIHPEVKKLYPEADVPEFAFDDSTAGVLALGYRSPRRLCAFAEGLLEGTAEWFGERVTLDQPQCMHRGDLSCQIVCRFESG